MTATGQAREVLERLHDHMSGGAADEEVWAEDVVVETPFAPPGRPRRWEGREAFLAFARQGIAAVPMKLERRNVVIHDTADPETIVVEYELGGVIPGTGHQTWAPFIGVLKVRDGQVARWREYQDPLVMAMATGRLPALLASLGAQAE